MGLGRLLDEAEQAAEHGLSHGHAPAGKLHQGVGRLDQAHGPVRSQPPRGRLQRAGQFAFALGHTRAAEQLNAAAQPFTHPRQHRPRPGAGVVLGDHLLALLLQVRQQPRQQIARPAVHFLAGQVGQAIRQGVGVEAGVGQDPGARRLQLGPCVGRRELFARRRFALDLPLPNQV